MFLSRLRTFLASVGLCFLVFFAAVPKASAANLVQNPIFDVSYDDWSESGTGFGFTRQWHPLDANDDPASGSFQMELEPTTGSVFLSGLFQSVPIEELTDYTFGADILMPESQSSAHKAQVFMTTFEDPQCFGSHQGLVVATGFVSQQGEWETVATDLETPESAQCARVWFRVIGSVGNVLSVHYDNAFVFDSFELEGIFRSGFE
ncbi:MAG: hypothetical protein DHS20C11_00040 [Lysobacteraceae bacterium]|nr:MAG: hypothetical protein DHS20C11_00040 [Xanthomonadaceae bacterium]